MFAHPATAGSTQATASRRSIRLVSSALLALVLAGAEVVAAAAEPSAEQADADVETMIVTAYRIPVSPPQVGSAVSTVTRKQLDDRQSVFTTDMLRDLPGVNVSRTAGYGSQTQVRIRGAEANHVLVLIDGVEANDPAGNDEFDFASLMSYDVERIELLRGPQSALWGSDATAGVINVTTRRGTRPTEGSAFLEAGSLRTIAGGGRMSVVGERGGVNLAASYFDTDGDSAADAGNEDDGYDNLTLSANSHFDITDTSRVTLFARYTDGTTEFDDVDFTTGLPADADLESDDSLLLSGATGTLSLFDGRWDHSLKLTYLDSDRDQSRGGADTSSVDADKTGIYYQSTLQLPDWASFSNQHLIVALDHEDEDFAQRGDGSPFGDPNQSQNLDTTGYIAEILTQPLTGLNLSASVRYDDSSDFDNVTTYRFTAAYQLPRFDTRLHSSYGKSQKSPTFIERFGFFPDQFVGNPSLQPEENRGFDVGVNQGFFSGRLRTDVTYFSERLDNEIDGFVFDPNSFLFTAENLDRDSRRNGLEVELTSQLTNDLDVSLSYTYTDAREPDDAGGRSREIRRPKHMAAANFNQRLLGGRVNINLNVSYTGEQNDRYFPPPTFAAVTQKLDSYVLIDLAGSYQLTPNLQVYARANNTMDEDYENVFGFRSLERALYAGVRMDL